MKKGQKSTAESGKRLKELLDEEKMTQVELAELTNYTPQHIHNIIKGHRNMSREAAHSFANIFGIDEGYLLCEIDHKNLSESIKAIRNNSSNKFNNLDNLIELLGYKKRYVSITHYEKNGQNKVDNINLFIEISKPNGQKIYCHEKDYSLLIIELIKYIDFKLDFICSKESINDNDVYCMLNYNIPLNEHYRINYLED